MNAIIRWLRPVPAEPAPKPTHAADRDSQPALALVRPARVAPVLPAPRVPRVVAGLDDPTPIFDAVMNGDEWDSLPDTAMLTHLGFDGVSVTYTAEAMPLTNPPVDIQFEVAFILDELDDDERREEAVEAALAVDHGWEPSGGAA